MTLHHIAQTCTRRREPHREVALCRQEGSAYIITLMVMFALTVIGLGLSLVSQTELLVGSQERTIQRNFYAADSGLGAALAAVLADGDYRGQTFRFVDTIQINGSNAMDVNDMIETTAFVPILDAPCNLCQINQDADFFEINHAVTARATRTGSDIGTGGGANDVPIARKDVTVMLEMQPWGKTTNQYAVAASDISKIKF